MQSPPKINTKILLYIGQKYGNVVKWHKDSEIHFSLQNFYETM